MGFMSLVLHTSLHESHFSNTLNEYKGEHTNDIPTTNPGTTKHQRPVRAQKRGQIQFWAMDSRESGARPLRRFCPACPGSRSHCPKTFGTGCLGRQPAR